MYDPSPRDERFMDPVQMHMPPPSFTPAPRQPRYPMLLPVLLIVCNAAVWLWMAVLGGVNPFSPTTAALEEWGGNNALLSLNDQPWRLFTSMFLHAGAMHLFVNMYFLFQIGPLLVRRKGHVGFAVVYLGGGLLASMASAWWQLQTILRTGAGQLPRLIVSVGASGAIMAVAGALACSLVLGQWRALHAAGGARNPAYSGADGQWMDKQLMQSLLQVIAMNVAMGFFIKGLDQAAHLGGLLAGAVLAWVLPGLADRASAASRGLRTLAAAGLSVLLLGAAWVLIRQGQQFERAYELLLRYLQQAG